MGGVLVVSKAIHLFPSYQKFLEDLKFRNITVTAKEKDGLNMLVNELKPRLLMIDSGFYQAGTPRMMGELLERFPKLNIAAVSTYDYPVRLGALFIWHKVKSYVDLWEGLDEFKRGLQIVRDGGQYISPAVQNYIDRYDEWPDTRSKMTKRLKECLIMLCCGFLPERIGDELHITGRTVTNHLQRLYAIYHVKNREEMVALAWILELVTKNDIRFYNEKRGNNEQ